MFEVRGKRWKKGDMLEKPPSSVPSHLNLRLSQPVLGVISRYREGNVFPRANVAIQHVDRGVLQ